MRSFSARIKVHIVPVIGQYFGRQRNEKCENIENEFHLLVNKYTGNWLNSI